MRPTLLQTILEPARLSVRFQPIFRISSQGRRVHSVEALVRGPQGTPFERADILFDYVRRKKAENAVDRSCLCAICEEAAVRLPKHFRFNVNVHAASLAQKTGFTDFLLDLVDRHSLRPEQLTVEIVEHAPTCDVPGLASSLAMLRTAGVHIALDDVGLGQSNYRMMVDCQPDYFKLDSYFLEGLKDSPRRLAVVESVTTLAVAMNSSVVAEGVSSAQDLEILCRMGVEFAQSNFLCAALPLKQLRAAGYLGEPTKPSATAAGGPLSEGLLIGRPELERLPIE
jgi:EAL domain-containing protein (putative c-di-GMP-specific phosphodiesterase class I)